jgi:hypothetical protein
MTTIAAMIAMRELNIESTSVARRIAIVAKRAGVTAMIFCTVMSNRLPQPKSRANEQIRAARWCRRYLYVASV